MATVNKLSEEKRAMILRALVEGNSIRAPAGMLGPSVLSWTRAASRSARSGIDVRRTSEVSRRLTSAVFRQ